MSTPSALQTAAGTWTGQKHLYLPDEPTRSVASTATVAPAAGGRFCTIAYTWSFEEQPQDGLLLIGPLDDPAALAVAWVDSWHMSSSMMLCQRQPDASGAVNVRGSYQVEQSPDWGWRIVIQPGSETLRIVMHNISPEGEEFLGVEALYTRAHPTPP